MHGLSIMFIGHYKTGSNKDLTYHTKIKLKQNLLNQWVIITVALILDYRSYEVVNSSNSYGWTPLIYAIERRDLEKVHLLLDHDAGIEFNFPPR